jgi:hypothetical protein
VGILTVCQWLADQQASEALRNSIWVYPAVESVHVLSLCLFLGFAVIFDLRLLNISLKDIAVSALVDRLLPWLVVGFGLMVVSGALLFYSDPVRFYGNIFFRIKGVMLVLAGVNVFVFHRAIYSRVADWDSVVTTPWQAKMAGGCSLVLWIGIVAAGRMIAYNWFK